MTDRLSWEQCDSTAASYIVEMENYYSPTCIKNRTTFVYFSERDGWLLHESFSVAMFRPL